MAICRVEGCGEKHKSKGYCGRHYMHIYKHGKILKRTKNDPNEIIIKGNIAETVLYNRKCQEVARAIIDIEDVEKVKKYKWYRSKGYARGRTERGLRYMHHVVLNREPSRVFDIDHKDRNKLNNCKSNLRVCKHEVNCWNTIKPKNNTSGYIGVSQHGRKWLATIGIKSKQVHLGLFKTKEKAAKAYNEAVVKNRDEFASLNEGMA